MLAEVNEDALLADGFEGALIGYVTRFGQEPVALYDHAKCIAILARDMGEEEAVEFFSYNTLGAWAGEGTPAFAVLFPASEEGA